MVVNPGLAGALYYLGVVLGRIAGGVVTNEQLALAVGIAVIVVVLVVDDKLHVLGRVEVDPETERLRASSEVVSGVEVAIFITHGKFDITPGAPRSDSGRFGAIVVVVLTTAEKKIGSLRVPTVGPLGSEVVDLLVQKSPAGEVGALIAQPFVETGKLCGPGKLMVKTCDDIGVEVLLPVDARRVAAAVARGSVSVGGCDLRLTVGYRSAKMKSRLRTLIEDGSLLSPCRTGLRCGQDPCCCPSWPWPLRLP